MRIARLLRRDRRGAAAIEFVLAAPMLVVAVVGIAQCGRLFLSNAEIQNAVGVTARYATIYPRPTQPQLRAKLMSAVSDLNADYMGEPSFAYGKDGTSDYVDIGLTYAPRLDFIGVKVSPVTLRADKRSYLQPTKTP